MKYDVDTMVREVESAKLQTKRALSHYRSMVEGFTGPWYGHDVVSEYEPENHAYQWVTTTMPQKVFDNPGWMVSTRKAKYQAHARMIEEFLNRWNVANDFQQFLSDGPARDMDFAMGIALVKFKDWKSGFKAEDGEEPFVRDLMPTVERVSPEAFIWDPGADCQEKAMYMGHRTVWDRDELMRVAGEEEGWDKAAIEDACKYTGEEDIERARKMLGLDRDEVVTWEIWCRGHGIVTLFDPACQRKTGKFPREKRDFYGPECGPYALFRGEKVPEKFFPLPPLVAVQGQSKDFNAVSNAVTREIEAFKEFIVTNDQKLANKIATDDTLHVYHSATAKAENLWAGKVGGLSNEMMAAFEFKRQRLDSNSGMTEAQRGQTQTGATATADTIANTAAQLRMSGVKRSVEIGVERIGYLVSWYAFHEAQVAMYMGEGPDGEAVWFRGGPMDEDDSFDNYDLSIKAYSMERPSEAQRATKVQFYTQVLPNLAMVMPQTPHVDWGFVLDQIGDSMGIPDLRLVVRGEALAAETKLSFESRKRDAEMEKPTPVPQQVGARALTTTTGSGMGGANDGLRVPRSVGAGSRSVVPDR